MFSNLVESDPHREETARRSWFFLGTMAAYALLMMMAGVASIYAYDAHLEDQATEYEITFVPPVQPEAAQPARVNERHRPAAASDDNTRRIAERAEPIARISESTAPPDRVSSEPLRNRELPVGAVRITGIDREAGSPGGSSGPPGFPGVTGNSERNVAVDIIETPPPRVEPTPAPPPKVLKVSQLLNGRAVSLPKPAYSQMAKIAKAAGPVSVQVLIDESGRVVSAQAVSGHVLLRADATRAALQARFSPTILGGVPVKVSGVITYNFVLQ